MVSIVVLFFCHALHRVLLVQKMELLAEGEHMAYFKTL